MCSRKVSLLTFLVLNPSKEKWQIAFGSFCIFWKALTLFLALHILSLCSQLLVLGTHLCRLALCLATGCLSHSAFPEQASFFVLKPCLSFLTIFNPRLICSCAHAVLGGWLCSPACCCDWCLPTEFSSLFLFSTVISPTGALSQAGVVVGFVC